MILTAASAESQKGKYDMQNRRGHLFCGSWKLCNFKFKKSTLTIGRVAIFAVAADQLIRPQDMDPDRHRPVKFLTKSIRKILYDPSKLEMFSVLNAK
jgi:hypothetical protein